MNIKEFTESAIALYLEKGGTVHPALPVNNSFLGRGYYCHRCPVVAFHRTAALERDFRVSLLVCCLHGALGVVYHDLCPCLDFLLSTQGERGENHFQPVEEREA